MTTKVPKYPEGPQYDEARQIANAARKAIIDCYLALPEEEQMRLYHSFSRGQLSITTWLQDALADLRPSTTDAKEA